MSNRELDAACARRLGFVVIVDYIGWWIGEKDDNTATHVFDYSSDPSAARYLEDEIERRGVQVQYLDTLVDLVLPYAHYELSTPDIWRVLRATPEQRVRAFLAATE